MGLETDHNPIYTVHWVHKKIRIYLHMTLDTEKYQNICICNIGIRNRSQPYLYGTLGTQENQNLSTHDIGYREISKYMYM